MIKKELNYDQVCHLTGTNFAFRVLTEKLPSSHCRPGLYSAFPGLSINPSLSHRGRIHANVIIVSRDF